MTMKDTTVTFPLAPFNEKTHNPSQIACQISGDESRTFQRIRSGLVEHNAKLKNGRPVYSWADVLRWMLETIHDAAANTPDETPPKSPAEAEPETPAVSDSSPEMKLGRQRGRRKNTAHTENTAPK